MADDPVQATVRYTVRQVRETGDLRRLQAFRAAAFGLAEDVDPLDAFCDHVLIEDAATGALCAGFRMQHLGADRLDRAYAARFYDLAPLAGRGGPFLEIGRFCTATSHRDSDLVRLAWAVLAAEALRAGTRMLFGCTSFAGIDPARHGAAFAQLAARHRAPWAPRPVVEHLALSSHPPALEPLAQKQMPPLLRSYLGMGAQVGGHAAIDRTLGTLHVFTALEVARVPPARLRRLRDLARAHEKAIDGPAARA